MILRDQTFRLGSTGDQIGFIHTALTLSGINVSRRELREKNFGHSTEDATRRFQRSNNLAVDGVVTGITADRMNAVLGFAVGGNPVRVVHGTITDRRGQPRAGVFVKLFDRAIGGQEKRLGQIQETAADGSYQFDYNVEDLDGKSSGDLTVRVFNTRQGRTAIAASPTVFGVTGTIEINVAVGDAPLVKKAEFARVAEKVDPLLEDVDLTKLDTPDYVQIAQRTRLTPAIVGTYLAAKHDVARAGSRASKLAESLYGIYRVSKSSNLLKAGRLPTEELKGALTQAETLRIIDAPSAASAERHIKTLKDTAVSEVAEGAQNFGSISKLMEKANLSQSESQAFMDLYLADTSANVWAAIPGSGISTNKAQTLRTLVEVNTLVSNNPELAAALVTGQRVTDTRDLAKLSVSQMESVVGGRGISIPAGFGSNVDRARKAYAEEIVSRVEALHPTAVVANRWKADDTLPEDVGTFLVDQVKAFEFRDQNINDFLAAHPGAIRGANDTEALRTQLRQVQNLFRITPEGSKFQAISALWKAGLHSAHAVKREGEEKFVARFANAFGGEMAVRRTYQNATNIANLNLIMLLRYVWDQNTEAPSVIAETDLNTRVNPAAVDGLELLIGENPRANLKTLFNNLDYCDCVHCGSSLSPAAYFVDLLLYLQGVNVSGSSRTALAVLLERRPDLALIELSCDNTLKPMPYIDLVNEILESQILGQPLLNQTSLASEILQATPEHVETTAYDALAANIFPWVAPFNLWMEEARVFLGQLGINRADLMRTLSTSAELSLLGDSAGIAPSSRDVQIAADYFGVAGNAEWTLLSNHAANDAERRGRWGIPAGSVHLQLRGNVRRLTDTARISLDELDLVLQTDFVRTVRNGGLQLTFDADHPCDVDHATLPGMTVAELDRIYRLVRLSQRLGISVLDVDRLFRAINPSDVDDLVVVHYAQRNMMASTGAGLEQVLTWSAPVLETRQYLTPVDGELVHSSYERIFLDETLFVGAGHARSMFQLNSARNGLVGPGTIDIDDTSVASLVAAAVNIKIEELNQIVTVDLTVNKSLSLANLSHVSRVASFAHANGLDVAEYYMFQRLLGEQVLTSPSQTLHATTVARHVVLLSKIQSLGLDLHELAYIVLHAVDSRQLLGFGDDRVDEDNEVVRAELVAGTTAPAGSQTAVEGVLSAHFGMTVAAVEYLLATTPNLPGFNGQTVLTVLSAPGFLNASDNQAQALAADALEMLRKCAFVLELLEVGLLDQLRALELANAGGWIDLAGLPVSQRAVNSTTPLLAFMKLVELVDINRRVFLRDETLMAYLQANSSSPGDTLPRLAAATGWPLTDIGEVISQFGLSNSLQAADDLILLDRVFAILTTVGVGAATAWRWRDFALSSAVAEDIRLAVKAKYDASEWLNVAASLRDPLRERQRDVLLATVQHNMGLDRPEDVYARLLVDTQTNAMVDTSRIKLALSSVQTFIQQAMHAPGTPVITFTADQEKEWAWRKAYRIWEANRKVFLYPENWIYPELRDDKTPLFLELENQLAQSDLTTETAEQAYLAYLKGLDRIANLQTTGIYRSEDRDLDNVTLHVVARTRSAPYQYYYRRWEDERVWTPWQSVDANIEADNVIPVVHNRRLFLFWPQFVEKTSKLSSGALKQKSAHQGTLPSKYYEVRIAWVQYHYGEWSDVQVSTDYSTTEARLTIVEKRDCYLFAERLFSDELMVWMLSPLLGARFLYNDITDTVELQQVTSAFSHGYGPTRPKIHAMPEAALNYNWAHNTKSDGSLSMWAQINLDQFGDVDSDPGETVLKRGSRDAVLTLPHQSRIFTSQAPFFFADNERNLFVVPNRFSRLVPDYEFPEIPWELYLEYPWQGGLPIPPGPMPDPIGPFDPDIGFGPDDPLINPGRPGLGGGVIDPDDFVSPVDPGDFGDIVVGPGIGGPVGDPAFGGFIRGLIRDVEGGLIGGVGALGNLVAGGFEGVPAHVLLGEDENTVSIGLDHGLVLHEVAPADNVQPLADRVGFAGLTPHPDGMSGGNFGDVVIIDRPITIGDLIRVPEQRYKIITKAKYQFLNHYHPYAGLMIRQVNRFGLEGLLAPAKRKRGDWQLLHRQQGREEYFEITYSPTSRVRENQHPVADFDFDSRGAYALYNWELFFHAPLLIAERLRQNRKFEDAQRWLHYIFDPTLPLDADLPLDRQKLRFWKLKPFFTYGDVHSLASLAERLRDGDRELESQVEAWEQNPFNPHLIARMRVISYMKAVVMKYLDNLIDWGDALFRRDTIESVNEATQIYVLAANILGREPDRVAAKQQTVHTFQSISQVNLSAILEEQESRLPPTLEAPAEGTGAGTALAHTLLHFCLPPNDKLFNYWRTVADRLYKIRNSMNIEGVRRALALFEPPIDPGMLVKAAAQGLDFATVAAASSGPGPLYRFSYMLPKAYEFCADVRGLGAALNTALEKKDQEALSRLRAANQVELLKQARELKTSAIDEAEEMVASLSERKAATERRLAYFTELLESGSTAAAVQIPGASVSSLSLSDTELQALALAMEARVLERQAHTASQLGSMLALIPNIIAGGSGAGGSPHATVMIGGQMLAKQAELAAAALRHTAGSKNSLGAVTTTVAGYERRQSDWLMQQETTALELAGIEKDILAAEIRVQSGKSDLKNHDMQIKHLEEEERFLESKFTSTELYSWMASRLSALYFQSYQMAYEVAQQAQMCFQTELLSDATFIEFGYWDNLRKGLLAGESLQKDLRRMEIAYYEKNARELELTKHIALTAVNPQALMDLRDQGTAEFWIPEVAFDLDYPGHYKRRIRSVGLTIPSITGPYTTVGAKLTLLSHVTRSEADLTQTLTPVQDATSAIATSSGQNDSGLFEFNLRDERYLPFEYAGAISRWRLELTHPAEFPAFDTRLISDVILHMQYSACDGGDAYRAQVESQLSTGFTQVAANLAGQNLTLSRMLSATSAFQGQWHRMLNPADGDDLNFDITLDRSTFPYVLRKQKLKQVSLDAQFVVSEIGSAQVAQTILDGGTTQLSGSRINLDDNESLTFSLQIPRSVINRRTRNVIGVGANKKIDPDAILDLVLTVSFEVD